MARIRTHAIDTERVTKRLNEMFRGPDWLAKEAQRREDADGNGCSERTVWRLLAGGEAYLSTIRAISDILGVNPRWLMGEVDDPTPVPDVPPPQKKRITHKLPGNLADYTPEQIKAIWEQMIRDSGKDGDGDITKLEDGSVIVEVELDADLADAVLAAFAAGKYAELGVTELREVVEETVKAEPQQDAHSSLFNEYVAKHKSGDWVEGIVVSHTPTHCMVELSPGVLGYLSITDVNKRLRNPKRFISAFPVGKSVRVRIGFLGSNKKFIFLFTLPGSLITPPSIAQQKRLASGDGQNLPQEKGAEKHEGSRKNKNKSSGDSNLPG